MEAPLPQVPAQAAAPVASQAPEAIIIPKPMFDQLLVGLAQAVGHLHTLAEKQGGSPVKAQGQAPAPVQAAPPAAPPAAPAPGQAPLPERTSAEDDEAFLKSLAQDDRRA